MEQPNEVTETKKDFDSLHVITVELGKSSDDIDVAVTQLLVLAPVLIFVWPDFVLLQRGELFEAVRCVFGVIIVVANIFCVGRCMLRPHPMTVQISNDRIQYDSGRPGVKYLMDHHQGRVLRKSFRYLHGGVV